MAICYCLLRFRNIGIQYGSYVIFFYLLLKGRFNLAGCILKIVRNALVFSHVKRETGRAEVVKKNLTMNDISKNLIFNWATWHCVIHVADLIL